MCVCFFLRSVALIRRTSKPPDVAKCTNHWTSQTHKPPDVAKCINHRTSQHAQNHRTSQNAQTAERRTMHKPPDVASAETTEPRKCTDHRKKLSVAKCTNRRTSENAQTTKRRRMHKQALKPPSLQASSLPVPRRVTRSANNYISINRNG